MKILMFKDEDCKKDGTFKAKNNSKEFTEDEFKEYVKSNDLTLSYGYIDLIGFTSNGFKFRCYYKDLVIGVSGLIKKLEGDEE